MIEHMESENRHEFDVTIETFDHPRYELIATGDVFDGEAEVDALLRGDADRVPRPAQRADRAPPLRRRGDRRGDALRHPPRARSAGCPPTGRKFEMRFCAMFLFEEERLVCERVYFDAGDDPAPARDRPRPADAEGTRRDRGQPPADRRPGARRRGAAPVSRAAPGLRGAGAGAGGGEPRCAFASAPAGACACGIAIDATVTEESALVVERPGGEQIVPPRRSCNRRTCVWSQAGVPAPADDLARRELWPPRGWLACAVHPDGATLDEGTDATLERGDRV